jgi:hypothetical protein
MVVLFVRIDLSTDELFRCLQYCGRLRPSIGHPIAQNVLQLRLRQF